VLSGVLHGLTETVQAGLVSGVVTVGKVESGNVETAFDQRLQLFDFPASRSKGAEDLGGTLVDGLLVQDSVEFDVSTGELRSFGVHLVVVVVVLL